MEGRGRDTIEAELSSLPSAITHRVFNLAKNVEKVVRPITPTVFGAAPSLTEMLEANKVSHNKKALFRCPTFWYYFRIYFPFIATALFCGFVGLGYGTWCNVSGFLALSSILSILGCLGVIFSYFMIVPWRKHPSSLMLYRTLCSFIVAVNILFNCMLPPQSRTNSINGSRYAFITLLMVLAGEGWLTSIAWDLVLSLTNPFTSYRYNLKRFQTIIWLFSGFVSTIFYYDTTCQASYDQGRLWFIKIRAISSSCLWGYLVFWLLVMYVIQAYAVVFATLRLRKGLPATFEVRKKCALETFECLWTYFMYMCLTFICFLVVASKGVDTRIGSPMSNFTLFFLFLMGSRGFVDAVCWFMLHDFKREPERPGIRDALLWIYRYSTLQLAVGRAWLIQNSNRPVTEYQNMFSESFERSNHEDQEQKQDSEGDVQRTKMPVISGHNRRGSFDKMFQKIVSEVSNQERKMQITEFDETDLSPQVNMALRQQVVRYVTTGIRDACFCQNLSNRHAKYWIEECIGFEPYFVSLYRSFFDTDPASVEGISEVTFQLEDKLPFKSFAPDIFKQIRLNEGITDEKYIDTLASTSKERLSEGASGAFMFFCGGGEFIVKTIRAREANCLHRNLPLYSHYIQSNPQSLLCRILGSYSLKVYAQTFYFIVMLNAFEPKAEINDRFDIKGSWVNRSADTPAPNKRIVCRHCNEMFIPAANEKCTAVVGKHEPNVVLKDNDLRIKISLSPLEARHVVDTLKKDSRLLQQMRVLDYSLLIGIKKKKFPIAHEPVQRSESADPTERATSSHATFHATSVVGPAVYYFGIVDFLQDWTFEKRVERASKILIGRKDPDGISVMPPDAYVVRFQNKMDELFEMGDDKRFPLPLAPEKEDFPDSTMKKLFNPENSVARRYFSSLYGHSSETTPFGSRDVKETFEEENLQSPNTSILSNSSDRVHIVNPLHEV